MRQLMRREALRKRRRSSWRLHRPLLAFLAASPWRGALVLARAEEAEEVVEVVLEAEPTAESEYTIKLNVSDNPSEDVLESSHGSDEREDADGDSSTVEFTDFGDHPSASDRLLMHGAGPLINETFPRGEIDYGYGFGFGPQGEDIMMQQAVRLAAGAYTVGIPNRAAYLRPMYAGLDYAEYMVMVANFEFNIPDGKTARYLVVPESLGAPQVYNGACRTNFYDNRVVAGSWGKFPGVRTLPPAYDVMPADFLYDGGILRADALLHFRMGGTYKICYSQDGTWGPGQGDILEQPLLVNGIQDLSTRCNSPPAGTNVRGIKDCLSNRSYNCYLSRRNFNTRNLRYGLVTSCEIDFSYVGAAYIGNPGRGTWSAEFEVEGYDSQGRVVKPLHWQACGSTPADFICLNGGACDTGNAYNEIDTTAEFSTPYAYGKGTIKIPAVRDDLEGASGPQAFKPRTVAACYCPFLGGCGKDEHFVQQIGLLHFYLSKVCHVGELNDPTDITSYSCKEDYTGVTGQYAFRIRIECPTDACSTNDGSRIKMIARNSLNDAPSWSVTSGCRDGEDGLIYNKKVFPRMNYELISGKHSGVINPPNCDGPLDCALSGGTRQDYKDFGGDFGFRFDLGHTLHEKVTFDRTHLVDVCYCNEGCGNGANWFKAGGFRFTGTRIVSSATSRSSLPAQWSIEFVNQPGTFGLDRPYADGYVLGLNTESLLKIIKDQDRQVDDYACYAQGYSSQLVDGLSNQVAAAMSYLGMQQTKNPIDLKKIVFNQDFFSNTITVKESGTIAICYCAITTDGICRSEENWKIVTRLTIKGPKLSQRWFFSTNVVFRFSYEGYGLTSGDKLRIIAADSDCTSNNYNPNTAAFAFTGLKVNCPVPCDDVGQVDSNVTGDLSTMVLTEENYDCLTNNQCRQTNYIETITVVSDDWTEILFEHPHGLLTGDEITLGGDLDNIVCDPDPDPKQFCTPDTIAALKGVYKFADTMDETKNGLAPSTYMNAHRLRTIDGDPFRIQINVGWPEAIRPKFYIIKVGYSKAQGLDGERGQWTHHSRAITREEIMATTEKANLRVCWKFGTVNSDTGKYVQEVGKITVRDPAPMEGAMLSMTTTSFRQIAPMIITFKTAGGVTGERYDAARDSLRLKVMFKATDKVDIYYTTQKGQGQPPVDYLDDPDGTQALIPENDIPGWPPVSEEDDVEDAKQSICGKLFLEMWSSDTPNGFPMPKGCYYKTYSASNVREVFMIFEPMSGLRKDSVYQLVFHGVVKSIHAGTGGQYVEIFPMDDVVARPYEAIERGIVTMTSDPQYSGGGAQSRFQRGDEADPRFKVPGGFKIVGGFKDLLTFEAGDEFNIELMGHGTTGKIIGGSILRMFLSPFTQWRTTSACRADCVAAAESSFNCGAVQECSGVALVPGMGLNMLKIVLPPDGEWGEEKVGLFGQIKAKMKIGGITAPSGGFFPQRFAVQVTRAGVDDFPHYSLSDGNVVWKQPNEGIPVSKVVSTLGGGNDRPFRGQTGNILYARILLASTIFARTDDDTDAYFTIKLPPGYTCVDMNPKVDGTGKYVNAWEAESDLDAFGSIIPQGRGTPSDSTIMHGWSVDGNTCRYTPRHPNGVIYQGSSMFAKITVDNPSEALPRSDLTNLWTIRMSNRGLYPEVKHTNEFIFLSSGDPNYASTSSVLGIITQDSCQPSLFAQSNPRAVRTEVRFFFRTEQEVEGGGMVRVTSPDGFVWPDPCQPKHLPSSYYATASNPTDATLPLPGDLTCTVGEMKREGKMYNSADIKFTNILFAKRLFGFAIEIQNPNMYDISHSENWRIYTADSEGSLVDGTPSTVPFITAGGPSWTIYRDDFASIAVVLNDTRPHVMRQTNDRGSARVNFVFTDIKDGNSGFIRILAPPGYKWDFEPEEVVYTTKTVFENSPHQFFNGPQAAGLLNRGDVVEIPREVSKEIESRVIFPLQGAENEIILTPGNFDVEETYFLSLLCQIPPLTEEIVPIDKATDWIVQFGFNETGGKFGAATIPAQPVKALRNAAVDYSTNIIEKESKVEFVLETVSDIEEGGFIQIFYPRPPAGGPEDTFVTQATCDTERVRDPALPDLLPLICKNKFGPSYTIEISPVSGTVIKAGLLAFAIRMENPKLPVLSYNDPATPCGKFVCWRFKTFGPDKSTELDYQTYAPGYSINNQMLEARIPSLTEEQRRGTKRDDRPLMPNNVIFAFKLQFDIPYSDSKPITNMMIRSPYGFAFPEECLPTIFVSETTVFSKGQRFPEDYDVWPDGVNVTDCQASVATQAQIKLHIARGSSGLVAGKLYLIRIGILANPLNTPDNNYWAIEIEQESAEPIDGMTLWAFTDTQIIPTTTARGRTVAGQARVKNPLEMYLRPFNQIDKDGTIFVEADLGFQFVHLASGVCDATLKELPYIAMGIQYPGYDWDSDTGGLSCMVKTGTDEDTRKVTIRLKTVRPIYSGLVYRLGLVVYNPRASGEVTGTSDPTTWYVSSFTPDGLSLDRSKITSFRLNPVMSWWYYENPDPENPALEMRNGGARLPDFSLQMQFPTTLENGDTIDIVSPEDFDLTDISGNCKGFLWIDPALGPTDTPDPSYTGPFFATPPPKCTANSLKIEVQNEPIPIARDTILKFGLKLDNPLRTPALADNFWACTHKDAEGIIKTSKAFQSWDIIPQFEDVEFRLLGPKMSAESISALRISFTAVSDAEDIAIQVTRPIGFNFDGVVNLNSGQEVILTAGNQIRIRMKISQNMRYTIDLDPVLLGRDGGQTNMQLTSWKGGRFEGIGDTRNWVPGTKQDERVRFTDGFRLPGRVSTRRYQRLYNDFRSDPQTYPVQSLWEVQMGRPAYVEFHFSLTREALPGDYLVLYGNPYQPTMRLFILQEAIEGEIPGAFPSALGGSPLRAIAAKIEAITGGQMHIKLEETLIAQRNYEVVVSVQCPWPTEVAEDPNIRWTIETRDNEGVSNTNDGDSRLFKLVERYDIQVLTSRAPPMSNPVVKIDFDPGISAPTQIKVVAPLGFNFSYNCLVAGGDLILTCNPGKPMPNGRAVAVLQVVEEGLRERPRDLRIRVRSPNETPVSKEWFIEGRDIRSEQQLGWGTAEGFEIQQMQDTVGVYPGIPGIRAIMVWRFRTATAVDAGGWLVVSLPQGFSPECGPGQLIPIALPLSGGCDTSDLRNVRIFLNSTIVPSEYAFGMYVTPPPSQPLRNVISLTLKNRYGDVEDGAMNLPAPVIQDKIRVRALPLAWTSARAGYSTLITIGFSVLESLPDLVITRTQQVSEILIVMPYGFTHEVEQIDDFTILNDDMPLRNPKWLDYMQKDQLRVTLELNVSNSWTTLREGEYSFRFPARVPDPLPVFNTWHLALCVPPLGPGCQRLNDPSVLVVFPMPGFALGSAGGDIASATGAAVRTSLSASSWLPLFLPLCFLLPGFRRSL